MFRQVQLSNSVNELTIASWCYIRFPISILLVLSLVCLFFSDLDLPFVFSLITAGGSMLCNPKYFSTLPAVGFSNNEFCPTCSCSVSC